MTIIPFPKRQLRALPTEIRAYIERGRGERLACTLQDLTWRGGLINTSNLILPNSFTLLLPGFSKSRRQCHVIWREADVVKVEFEDLA